MRKGGQTGPAVVPGKPDESLLVQAVRYEDELTRMPPKGKLPDAAIAALEQWIKNGAEWPSARPGSVPPATLGVKPRRFDLATARKHWAYQPIKGHDPPPNGMVQMTHFSIKVSSNLNGTDPNDSSQSWKARRSKDGPAFFSARRLISRIFSSPTL
jgi:hypothetical protein